ncbi:ATP-binding protein [Chenggangzhangella methanolivorans]|uniref:ATP-binding protein n=2 Tax=Chenggangzhangella methanolivorans TaxID=1437009 RepID=UPI003616755A
MAWLASARWPLLATAFVLASVVAAGRLGPWEGLLAFAVVLLATAVAPRASAPAPREVGGGVKALREELSAILSGLPDPVLVLDRRGFVTVFNERARAALGEIRIGEPVSFALRAPEVLEAVRAASSAPQTVLYVERAPVERWREAHVAQTRLSPGAGVLTVVALRDLTEQRRSERMRGDFVANASHELRTPLASLLGFIETLQGPAKNDVAAREKFLEIMRAQANRMSRLIDDLLSLSRIELKAHVKPRSVVDLAELVRGVADSLQPLARERGVEIALTLAQASVRGDRDELIRVAENLIENAVKYGQSGGRVDVGVDLGAEGARLVVRDYGPGVAPEHLPRLTERFYRVDVGDSRDKGGTGLGLALVKHILQRHGGRLTIESAAGDGATFTALLEPADAPANVGQDLKRAS